MTTRLEDMREMVDEAVTRRELGVEEPLAEETSEASAEESAGAVEQQAQPEPVDDTQYRFSVLYDRLLVKRSVARDTGLVVQPDEFREAPLEGRVILAGEGHRSDYGVRPLKVSPGDIVIFGKHSGVQIEVNGENLLLLREDEVLAFWARIEPPTTTQGFTGESSATLGCQQA